MMVLIPRAPFLLHALLEDCSAQFLEFVRNLIRDFEAGGPILVGVDAAKPAVTEPLQQPPQRVNAYLPFLCFNREHEADHGDPLPGDASTLASRSGRCSKSASAFFARARLTLPVGLPS